MTERTSPRLIQLQRRRDELDLEIAQELAAIDRLAALDLDHAARPTGASAVNVATVIDTVCDAYNITPAGLVSSSRVAVLSEARAIVTMILRTHGWTYTAIASTLKRADHTTSRSAHQRVLRDPALAATARRLDDVAQGRVVCAVTT